MKIRSLIVLTCSIMLFTTGVSKSQENFQPGYIITNQGDTVRGSINYRNWEINPREISFKQNAGGKTVTYTPLAIRSFSVASEVYESAIVKSIINLDLFFGNQTNVKTQYKTDTTFLQTLFSGLKNLYYFHGKDGYGQFYFKPDSAYELLEYRKYVKTVKEEKDKPLVMENKRYQGQLAVYLSDCPTIGKRLSNSVYNKTSLTAVYNYYFNCIDTNPLFEKRNEKPLFRFSLLAGASASSVKFSSNNFDYLTGADFSTSVKACGGISMDLVLVRNMRKWSFTNDLLLTSYTIKGHYLDYENENNYNKYDTRLGFTYLKLHTQARFTFPVKKAGIFANAGISTGFVTKAINETTSEKTFYSTVNTKTNVALDDYNNFEAGFLMGAGVRYGKLSVEVRHELSSGISAYPTLSSTTRRLYFLLGYRF